MPMGRGAIARSIMAFLPKRALMPLIGRYADDLRKVGVGETPQAIIEVLKRVKRAGVAVAFGEVTPGAIGIAAPILDSAKRPVAAISIAGPMVRFNESHLPKVSVALLRAAAEIHEKLGF